MGRDSTTKFIGLDVHSKTISVAIADEGRKGEVRHYGIIDNTTEAIEKVIKSLTATGAELKFIYEAGPCGFALYRYLTGNGFKCIVTSPAMIPKRGSINLFCCDSLQTAGFLKYKNLAMAIHSGSLQRLWLLL